MRILYLQTIALDTDFCRTSRIGLASALAAAGCDVTIIAGYASAPPPLPPGVRFVGVRMPRVPFVRQFLFNAGVHAATIRECLRRRPDIILLDPYTFYCAWPFDWLSRLGARAPRVVMDVRSGIFHERDQRGADVVRRVLRATSFRYARRVFAGFTTISPMLRDILVREYGLPADRIGLWQSAASSAIVPGARKEPERTGRPLRVMYHGSFGIDRGLEETVQAMRLLQSRGIQAELFLLGQGTQEPALRALAEGLDNVVFHRAVPHQEVPAHLARCDVGIVPFKTTPVMRSSSPLKLMEYLAAGRPVIASRIEAIEDVVGSDGAFFLRDQTPGAIADAIEQAVHDPERIARLGARGPDIIAEHFTWSRQAEGLRHFLSSLART